MKSKFLQITIVILVIAAIVIVIFLGHRAKAPAAKSSASTVPVSQTIQPENLISIAPTMVAIDNDSYLASVSGSYPQFPQADDAFNKKISDAITNDAETFNQSASDDYAAMLKNGGDEFQTQFANAKDGYYYFMVTSTVVQSNENFISVVIREEGFTGGAHPFHTILTFNYDVKNHKELTLTDLVPLSSASMRAREQLAQKFKVDGNLDSNIQSMIDDGTDPSKPENFQNFSFKSEAITVYFGEYQVAPYVDGEQQVLLTPDY